MKNHTKNTGRTTSKLRESRPYINRLAIPSALVVGAVAIAGAYPAYAGTASATLPNISAQSLISKILSAKTPIYAGSVQESINSGIPYNIINSSTQTSIKNVAASVAEKALTGGVSFNYWDNGSGDFRIQIPSPSSEIDLYKLGNTTWLYDSASNSVTKTTRNPRLPSPAQHQTPARYKYEKRPIIQNPNTLGKNILNKLPKGSTETVSSGPYVASQPTYTLSINTNDKKSSIKDIRLAVDANTFDTLGVYIDSYSSSNIFSMDYSMLSYQKPTNSVFSYAPAKGTAVVNASGQINLANRSMHSSSGSTAENSPIISVIEKLLEPGAPGPHSPGNPPTALGFMPPPANPNTGSVDSASGFPAGPAHNKLPIREILSNASSDMGISLNTLRSDLRSGKTLASIATANNISTSNLINELVSTFTANINSEVSSGRLSQDQANKLLSHLTAAVTDIVNNPLPIQFAEPSNPGAAASPNINPITSNPISNTSPPVRIIGAGFSRVTIINALPGASVYTGTDKTGKNTPTGNVSALLKVIKTIGTPETTSLGSGYLISLNFGSIFVANNGAMAFGSVPSHVLLHAIM